MAFPCSERCQFGKAGRSRCTSSDASSGVSRPHWPTHVCARSAAAASLIAAAAAQESRRGGRGRGARSLSRAAAVRIGQHCVRTDMTVSSRLREEQRDRRKGLGRGSGRAAEAAPPPRPARRRCGSADSLAFHSALSLPQCALSHVMQCSRGSRLREGRGLCLHQRPHHSLFVVARSSLHARSSAAAASLRWVRSYRSPRAGGR